MTGLTCVNCSKEIPVGTAFVHQGVLVCKSCFTIASALVTRAEEDMQKLLLLYKETIRVALCNGKLNFASDQSLTTSKKETLEKMLVLLGNDTAPTATAPTR
jgi:hypothetical protein